MELQATYRALTKNIEESCQQVGRDPEHVRLMAVSKGQPLAKILALHRLGHTYFGENYLPELLEKAQATAELSLQWSFIGTLQSNKIAKIMSVASEIQTLASEKHVRYVARYARELNIAPYPVFIEVNAGEAQKAGIPLDEVSAFADFISSEGAGSLSLQGLMCIPSARYDDSLLSKNKPLPDLYTRLEKQSRTIGKGLLSLGMSRDRKLAIASGSHVLRIGTALFGERVPRK